MSKSRRQRAPSITTGLHPKADVELRWRIYDETPRSCSRLNSGLVLLSPASGNSNSHQAQLTALGALRPSGIRGGQNVLPRGQPAVNTTARGLR